MFKYFKKIFPQIWLKDAEKCKDCGMTCHKKCVVKCKAGTICVPRSGNLCV